MTNKNKIILISSIVLVFLVGIILFNTLGKENTIKTYKVTFTSGNGEVIEQTVNEGETVQMPKEPTREGYIFVGWRYEGDIFDFSKGVYSDIILVAEWKEIKEDIETFVVKFDTDGGTTIANQVIEKGEKVSKPITPTKDGYIFKYWMLNDKEYDFGKVVNENITLKVSWEKVNNPVNNNNQNNNTNNNVNNNNNNVTNKEEIKIVTPVLKNTTLTACGEGCPTYKPTLTNGKYMYDLGINKQDYKTSSGYSVTGYVLYEKTSGGYNEIVDNSIDGPEVELVTIQPGEKKEYVARVYATNATGKRVYSDYSNVITINHLKSTTPVLKNTTLTACGEGCPTYKPTLTNGKYMYDLGINKQDYKTSSGYSVTGYVLYEKTSAGYNEIVDNSIDGPEVELVTIQPGEKKEYVARVYATNATGKRVYSDYSNVIIIDHSS